MNVLETTETFTPGAFNLGAAIPTEGQPAPGTVSGLTPEGGQVPSAVVTFNGQKVLADINGNIVTRGKPTPGIGEVQQPTGDVQKGLGQLVKDKLAGETSALQEGIEAARDFPIKEAKGRPLGEQTDPGVPQGFQQFVEEVGASEAFTSELPPQEIMESIL